MLVITEQTESRLNHLQCLFDLRLIVVDRPVVKFQVFLCILVTTSYELLRGGKLTDKFFSMNKIV